ncbi:MAG: helix-turn-helix domain-containing protein [Niveispirillum sp.]|nr:helix-turn-helix domain-containing protein [Niveispirillum sp.]
MGGFAKGLAVIEAFGRGRSSLTIADVARIANLDRATARRCLLTLVNTGYASSDGRQFELTPRILRLGHTFLTASLPRLIQPTLDQLADNVQESCSASVLDGNEVVYIARAARHRLMGVGLHSGSRLPAYCTSMGRALLASLPSDQCRALLLSSERPALTNRTVTDVDELMQELAKVRETGYALIDQEVEIGSRSIAVPVRNITGRTVAAINIGAHATRATMERIMQDYLPNLIKAQQTLGEILP